MKPLAFLSLLVVTWAFQSLDLDQTLKKIKSTDFGLKLLQSIPSADPVDKIIKDIANSYNAIDSRLEDSAKYNTQFQLGCKQQIQDMKLNLRDLGKKLKDTENNLARKKPRYDLVNRRLNIKKKQQQQLEIDQHRYLELREAENSFYTYNADQLDKAMQAITAIRNKFVQYLSLRQNRQRKAARPSSFLEDDEYDEEEEERQHYERYVFVQIQVAIQKVSQGLEMGGMTELLEGFQDICQQLHDIKEGNMMYDDTEATLNKISQGVIDICSSIMDWIGQVRRREDQAEDAKHDIAVQSVKLVKKQLSDTIHEIAELQTENASLAHSIESMEQSIMNYKYSLENNKDILKAKEEQCIDQDASFREEKRMLEEQLSTMGTLLDLLEQKGGQFKRALGSF